jgi:hypothetical protein
MSRRLDYRQIAPVGVKGGHLSLISQPDVLILEAAGQK